MNDLDPNVELNISRLIRGLKKMSASGKAPAHPAASKQTTLSFGAQSTKAKAVAGNSKTPDSDVSSSSLRDDGNAPPPPRAPTAAASDSAPLPAGPASKRPQAPKLTQESSQDEVSAYFTWRSKHGGVDPVPFEWTVEVVNTLMPLAGGPPADHLSINTNCVPAWAAKQFFRAVVFARGLILDCFACTPESLTHDSLIRFMSPCVGWKPFTAHSVSLAGSQARKRHRLYCSHRTASGQCGEPPSSRPGWHGPVCHSACQFCGTNRSG